MSDYRIPLASPVINDKIQKEVLKVLNSKYLIAGPKTELFESKLAKYTKVDFAVALSSGTAALLATMSCLNIGKDSTVIVPAFTFPAPAMAASFLGAKVRLVDVDQKTFNICPKALSSTLDKSVSLVIAIDQFGNPCPYDEIQKICSVANIPCIVDAACSLGSTYKGKPCGSMGVASILSFHPRKIITTAEGGAVLTNDRALAEKIKAFRNIGNKNGLFLETGINLRPSEMGSAMGIVQLDMLAQLLKERQALAAMYSGLPLVSQKVCSTSICNYQTYAAKIETGNMPATRNALIKTLAKSKIQAGIASYSLAMLPALINKYGFNSSDFPVAQLLHHSTIALPLFNGLLPAQIQEVKSAITNWAGEKNEYTKHDHSG